MGIGGHSSTSVAGSPGPENTVYATVSQGSLLLPPGLEVPMSSGTWVCRAGPLAWPDERRIIASRVSGHGSQDKGIEAGPGSLGRRGHPGSVWLRFQLPLRHQSAVAFPWGGREGEWKTGWTLSSSAFCSDLWALFVCICI